MATTTEDAEAKILMESWDKANPATDGSDSDDDDDDEPLSYDDMLDQYRRDVNPGNNELDHIVLGVSDLDKALDDFETMTGTRPVMVVSLNGVGTRSARVAFTEALFLEIIAPDPKQDTCTHMGDKLKSIPDGEFVPLHYAVRSTELEARKKVWREMGLDCDMVTMIAKDRGTPWKWDMWIVENHDDGGLVPYFCDWKGATNHASGRLPVMGDFGKLKITAPASSPVHKLLNDISGIQIETGIERFDFEFTTKTGSHTFTSSQPIGITFPK